MICRIYFLPDRERDSETAVWRVWTVWVGWAGYTAAVLYLAGIGSREIQETAVRTKIRTLCHFLSSTIEIRRQRPKTQSDNEEKILPYLQSSSSCKSSQVSQSVQPAKYDLCTVTLLRTFYCRPDISDKTIFLSLKHLTPRSLSLVARCHISSGHNSGIKEGEREGRGGEGRDGKIITTIVLDYLQCQIG